MLSIGVRWATVANPSTGFSPTRWVGDSGVTRAGNRPSISLSSRMSRSNSASEIWGSLST